MKKKIIDILNGIADGIFPTIRNSFKKTNDGHEVSRARLTASVLSWIFSIAMLKGWITFSQLVDLLKMIFTLE